MQIIMNYNKKYEYNIVKIKNLISAYFNGNSSIKILQININLNDTKRKLLISVNIVFFKENISKGLK